MKAWRYALARALGPGTCLRSDAFEAGGRAFQLEVFPAGLGTDCSQHLSLFLTTPGGASPSHVLYELAVVDQSGHGRHLLRASRLLREGPPLAQGRGVVAGYPCFVRSALLEKHPGRYLSNDSLVIRCNSAATTAQCLSACRSQGG
ncbi:TRAF-like protein [Scenedesmus sp. NREL 46B-D3]|nr:TRAF-like protein [Scenedesmus sp. NREL 46B-D3]